MFSIQDKRWYYGIQNPDISQAEFEQLGRDWNTLLSQNSRLEARSNKIVDALRNSARARGITKDTPRNLAIGTGKFAGVAG